MTQTLRNVQTALAEDVDELEKVLDKKGDVSLIVIDPVTNYLGGLSMNKENEMRDLLMPLAELHSARTSALSRWVT
jgi:hypothetical protein